MLLAAAQRRLQEELGISCALFEIGHFTYLHQFSQELYEYEYDHVFLGHYSGPVNPDPAEIAKTAWVSLIELSDLLLTRTEEFAPWFITAAPLVLEWIEKKTSPNHI